MVYAHTENFSDSMGSHGKTYMWQICSKIFIYNTSDVLNGQINIPCQNWFLDALERCSEMVFLDPQPRVHSWFIHQMMNLRYFIFPQADKTIATKSSHVLMHPEMLTKPDCNQLFVEAAKDYIEIAPRYSRCLEDNLYYAAFLKALFGLFILYLVLVFIKMLFSRKRWGSSKPKLLQVSPASLRQSGLFSRLRWFSCQSLVRHKFEVNHFRVDKTNVARLYCDPPTVAIKVKRKKLSQVLCSLVKSDPVADEQINGFTRNKISKSRGYALHKLNLFLNTRSYCRVIIDIGYDEDESDSDLGESQLGKTRSMSAGDQLNDISRQKESTMEESADTSSLSSYKVSRPRRYCSKYKQSSVHSGAWGDRCPSSIPTLNKYRDSLTRKESSNSVAILLRKDSRLMLRRSYESQKTGRNCVEV